MKTPFCENIKCPLHRIQVEPHVSRLTDPPRRIGRSQFREKNGKTIHLCEECRKEREERADQYDFFT